MDEMNTTTTQQEENTTTATSTETKNEEKFVSKELYDAKISELNKARKKAEEALRNKMTESERATMEAEEREREFSEMKKQLDRMNKEKIFLSQGYDAETSSAMAESIINGDMDTFVQLNKKWLDEQKAAYQKQLEEEITKNTPASRSGSTASASEETEGEKLAKSLAKQRSEFAENSRKVVEYYK